MKKIVIYENSDKKDAVKYAEITIKKLHSLGVECFARAELIGKLEHSIKICVHPCKIEEFEKYADLVISFGGDGTMLSISRYMVDTGIPIMGVNVGKLGFLAEFSVYELAEELENIFNGHYRIIDRSSIETKIRNKTIIAINDFVIEKRESSRMINIQAYANEHLIGDYRADGLIITTPTGSTAYSLSCGGPIIAPSTEVVCLTPISPHTLTSRPLVLADSTEITLKVHSPNGEVNFVADGQEHHILKNDETVVIKKSKSVVKMIKPLKTSYFGLLRKKLLWTANSLEQNF